MALYQTLGPIHSFAETACHEVEANVLKVRMEELRAAALRTSRLLREWKTTFPEETCILCKQRPGLTLRAWIARRLYLIHMKEAP